MNPNHVIPDSISSFKDGDIQDTDYTEGKVSTTDKLLDIWKSGQRKLNEFWNLWKNDYLLSLRERTQASLNCTVKSCSTNWRRSIDKGRSASWSMEDRQNT